MSYGVALRNGVALGLEGIVALSSSYGPNQQQGTLLAENGDNLVQENDGLILLE